MTSPAPPDPPPKNPASGSKPLTISELIGGALTLPGESAELYQGSLKMLLQELQARTVMQIYLAEKIHDCLWWIRRYEEQKRATIIAEMADQTRSLTQAPTLPGQPLQPAVRDALLANKIDKKLLETIREAGHTLESLRQRAMDRKRDTLEQLDEQIALQMKILIGFQASYEVAFNRKLNAERLVLQNALLRRDLQAIEGEVSEQPTPADRQSP